MMKFNILLLFYFCTIMGISSCQPTSDQKKTSKNSEVKLKNEIKKTHFGQLPDGQNVDLFTLSNANGMEAKITNYGGIIVSLNVPDRSGENADVVLGFDSFEQYLEPHPYFGAIIGRYGNRIANAQFSINGDTYTLAQNNGKNSLHGGIEGFDKKVWDAETNVSDEKAQLILRHTSPDGDEGFPGNLEMEVTYSLNSNNELWMEYKATSDKPTVVNMTNHAYFNLTGNGANDVLTHEAILHADTFLPIDENIIPTGELRPVDNTPFDFRSVKSIGADIKDEVLKETNGFDHCWVLKNGKANGNGLHQAAKVLEPNSGRVLEVLTTEPGMQFYTGNFLDGELKGKKGSVYDQYSGFCLETQHYPDSPNKPEFPSTLLKPGETYETTTVYKFSVE